MAPLLSVLKGIYYGTSIGALRGPQALFDQAKKMKVVGVTLAKCKQFLASQPVYTIHRPARRRYKRNTIEASIPGSVVQVDIMDMQNFANVNVNKYVLLSYDTFSKLLTGVPLLNREAQTVQDGLETLIDASPFPWLAIYWDKEGSFLSRQVQKFLKERGIHNYTTKSIVKAPGVERSIRTLRTLLQRRFEVQGSVKWERELPKIIANYNKRKHSTTKIPPNDLVKEPWLLANLRNDQQTSQHAGPPPLKTGRRGVRPLPPIGSYIRLNRLRGLFDKEASNTWTNEVFRVIRHKTTSPIPLIYVEDTQGEKIEGGLYPEEYQSVTWNGKKEFSHVVKTRKRQRKVEYLVSYKGWPPKFNEWLPSIPTIVPPK